MEVNALRSTKALLLIIEWQLSVYATKTVKHFLPQLIQQNKAHSSDVCLVVSCVPDPYKCIYSSQSRLWVSPSFCNPCITYTLYSRKIHSYLKKRNTSYKSSISCTIKILLQFHIKTGKKCGASFECVVVFVLCVKMLDLFSVLLYRWNTNNKKQKS